MKVLERTKEIKEVYGYESGDGIYFKTEEECKKYEETARYAIDKAFFDLCVKQVTGKVLFAESGIYENFGYGSEEYDYVILEVKNEDDLKIVNMYRKEHLCASDIENNRQEFDKKYIGKKVLVGLGYDWEHHDGTFYVAGTMDELIERFKNSVDVYFNPVIEEQKEQN